MRGGKEATDLRLRLVQIRMQLLSGAITDPAREKKLLAELETVRQQLESLGQPPSPSLLGGGVTETVKAIPPGSARGGGPVIAVRVRVRKPVRCWTPTPLAAARCDLTDAASWPVPSSDDWKRSARGDMCDLSPSGMLFEASSVLIVGLPAWFELGSENPAVRTQGILVRAERAEGGTYRVGVQFIEPDERAAATIARWVSEGDEDPPA